MSPADALDAEAIRSGCAGQLIGNRVVVFEEVTSTNDVVAQMAPESGEGLVVIAERQSAGRGQYGRRWESAPGLGLWMSVLLRPNIPVAESSRITDLLAEAIATTAERTAAGINARIKPPNDVYIGARKVAGVLAEMRVEASGTYCAIGGMGINVNHAASEFPPELQATAGSLAIAAGSAVDRQTFVIDLLAEVDHRYGSLRALSS
jgi:BirA family biotin operon repressor/biotin-[acetyl-CoA-carboxylase] ligase